MAMDESALRKRDKATEEEQWIGIRGQPEGREGRRKPGKGPFRRMQENVAKYEAMLTI